MIKLLQILVEFVCERNLIVASILVDAHNLRWLTPYRTCL